MDDKEYKKMCDKKKIYKRLTKRIKKIKYITDLYDDWKCRYKIGESPSWGFNINIIGSCDLHVPFDEDSDQLEKEFEQSLIKLLKLRLSDLEKELEEL